ncbi:MAG: M48 family metalloprotease [Burkholderiales bacterium]
MRYRLILAMIVALVVSASYFMQSSENPITGEIQRVALSPDQEIALGLQSAPQMAARFGGITRNERASALVKNVGQRLVARSVAGKSPYRFSFHVLADAKTINAFALPGGPVFITEGLLRLLRTEGEVAAVLGHEIGHVVARHGAEHLAKQQLTQGLVGAVAVGSGDYGTAQMAQVIGSLVNMKYGRDDELESDALGVRIMGEAGYDPRSMLRVMEVLARASAGARQPDMLSTHPNPGNRAERIQAEIAKRFPGGIPEGLTG